MGWKWAIACPWACAVGLLVAMALAMPASAQAIADDAAAREYFDAGRAAFDQADYESALTYFRHAYRTSGREALLYKIGVADDRLQRDKEALEAFLVHDAGLEREPADEHVSARPILRNERRVLEVERLQQGLEPFRVTWDLVELRFVGLVRAPEAQVIGNDAPIARGDQGRNETAMIDARALCNDEEPSSACTAIYACSSASGPSSAAGVRQVPESWFKLRSCLLGGGKIR